MKVTQAAAYALHAMMYMVRHVTQLPATTDSIAKAEGIPSGYLAKIFQRLVKARFVRSVRGRKRGYVFAKPPEEISLLELFEVIEGGPLFEDCFLRHCECGGTPENCYIYAQWVSATKKLNQLLGETSVATAAWNHPQHRFHSLPESLEAARKKAKKKASRLERRVRVT
ncbi:MAG: RrF2 family transcriptional regulator [Planctomycetota bacterium]|jgi:Rrf2 family protein